MRKGTNCTLTVARPLDAPARVPLAQSSADSQSEGLQHPFGLVFARRQLVRLSVLGMTNATANGTTSNDGSEEFDWIDDD